MKYDQKGRMVNWAEGFNIFKGTMRFIWHWANLIDVDKYKKKLLTYVDTSFSISVLSFADNS